MKPLTRALKCKKSRRSGLTLLEVLASITLLASLVAAMGAVCIEPARLLARSDPQVSFEESANALCDLIARDLDVFDLDPGELGPRVSLGEGNLNLRTRECAPHAGAVVHRFVWDATRGEIHLLILSRNGARTVRDEGVVLAHLRSASFALDRINASLSVTLTSDQYQTIERRWGMS